MRSSITLVILVGFGIVGAILASNFYLSDSQTLTETSTVTTTITDVSTLQETVTHILTEEENITQTETTTMTSTSDQLTTVTTTDIATVNVTLTKEISNKSVILERITLTLPFDPENPIQGIMPMGETLEHPEDVIVGGHPGIDFQWYNHTDGRPKIYASAAGVISVIAPVDDGALAVTIFHDDFKVVWDTGEKTYYTLVGPIDPLDFEFRVGDRIEAGGFLGYVYQYPVEELPLNVYMIHWEFGTWETVEWDPEDTSEGSAPENRLCPMTYFDDESRELIEEIWANPDSYNEKDLFPYMCNNIYHGKDE